MKITNNNHLSLNPISIHKEYRKEWNVHENDFLLLCNNDKPISTTLYRVGGLNSSNPEKDNYFLLLRYTEAFYSESLLKHCKDKNPKHLEAKWCIFNNKGQEKVVFDTFKHGYLVKNSCIYHIESRYYNIETGECYGYSSSSMESSIHLYLDLKYNTEKTGVLIIDKKTGVSELKE